MISYFPCPCVGFSLPPPHSISSSNTKHSQRHSSPNSSMLLDDSYVAKMIFDESNHQISPLVLNQKSPMHKSVSSLQDVTEIRRPTQVSSTPHRHLSGTQSLAYPPQTYDSNRSPFSNHGNDTSHDNMLHNKFPPHTSASLPGHAHEGSIHYHQNQDYRVPFTPSMTNSPNHNPGGQPYHRSSHDAAFPSTHATISVPSHPLGHRNSSPDNLYSPNYRSSYSGSSSRGGGNFSPEPSLGYSPRSRPHSTHSRGTPPPSIDPFQNPRNSRGISYNKDKEMDLAEALLMDQDEGTLV